MKKRLFFNMHYMELGGAEMALLGLLNAIDTEKYDVDLFINQHTGALMKYIPHKVRLLPEIPEYGAIERPIKTIIREGHWRIAVARIVGKMKRKMSLIRRGLKNDGSAQHFMMDEVIRLLPSLTSYGHYDVAVSFIDPPHIVQDKVDADIKIEWIHTDFSTIKIDKKVCGPRWAANDYIVSISEAITEQFKKTFPDLSAKLITIENILSAATIRARAEEFSVLPSKSIKLLSVGRYVYAKNYDNVPDICRRIVENGFPEVEWSIIGFGSQAQLIREKIAEAGMEKHVKLLGKRDNPYPYIKACDIYVQPSRYEGKSITVREAQILCRPVVITNYPSSKSQVIDGVDGIISEMDNASIAQTIVNLINDKVKRSALSAYLAGHDYGMESEVEKFYQLIG